MSLQASDEQNKKEITQSFERENYKWYRDKKIIGTMILLIAAALQIFAFLKIPFLTTIHAYTIGMVFGYFNPLFYLYVIYISLTMILGSQIKLPKWFKLNSLSYFIIVVLILFIASSTGYYQSKGGWTSIGFKSWGAMQNWFDEFRSEPWYTPANTNGGCLGVILYCFFAMIASGIGALIISVIGLAIIVSYIISGSSIGFYKTLISTRRESLKSAEIDEEGETVEEKIIKATTKEIPLENNKKKNEDLPFEDPF